MCQNMAVKKDKRREMIMRITNGKLLTMEGQCFEKGYVDFENAVVLK